LRDAVIGASSYTGRFIALRLPRGTRRFGEWLREQGQTLGRCYVSELRRNWK
jgi:hypothetical protein